MGRFDNLIPSFDCEGDDNSGNHGGTAAGGHNSARNYADNVPFGARQGHGFAAERANDLYDRLTGRDAQLVGGNNAKDGPDRIVDGSVIQTKYCATGKRCIEECFDGDRFRYIADGKPMQIEVASDTYPEALAEMQERIRKGQVPGVKNPKEAENLVRKGNFTYAQAKNIARFGTIESLTYDAVNGISVGGSTMGVTAIITMAVKLWNGEQWQAALDAACFEGLCVGGVAWASSIAAAQMGRTSLETSMRAGTDWLVKQMGSKVASTLANSFRPAGKEIYGQAAKNHVSKLLRGNIATTIAVTAVLSIDDLHSLFVKEISGTQAFKNIATTTSGVAGGAAGLAWGSALGSLVPGPGTFIGGVVGATVGGLASSTVVKTALNKVWDDDSVNNGQLLEASFIEVADDYLLSDKEAEAVLKKFKQFVDLESRMKLMQAVEYKRDFAIKLWLPFVEEQVRKRAYVALPSSRQLSDSIVRIAGQIETGETVSMGAETYKTLEVQDEIRRRIAAKLGDPTPKAGGQKPQPTGDDPEEKDMRELIREHWGIDVDELEPSRKKAAKGGASEGFLARIGSRGAKMAGQAAAMLSGKRETTDVLSVPRVVEPKPIIRPLSDFIQPYQDIIGDGKQVFAGNSLFTKKGEKKHESARKKLGNNEYEWGLVVMDSTTWGSVEEGIFITEQFLYCKAFLEDQMVFRIDKIEAIHIDAEDTELVVNGKRCKYGYDSATKPLKLAVQCIEEYLAQFR